MSTPVTPLDRLLQEASRRQWKDAELCRRLKITHQRLNNWKSRGLPVEAAVAAAQRLSLSLDYLIFGKPMATAASAAPAVAAEPLTLYGTTPDRQTKLLDMFDQLTPAQQDEILKDLEAHVAANAAVVKHFSGKRLRHAGDERIEAAYGLPSKRPSGP